MNKRRFTLSTIFALALASGAMADELNLNTDNFSASNVSAEDFDAIVEQGISPAALRAALNAQQWAIEQGKVKNTRYLTIVEFNKPSDQKRLHVIDLETDKVIYNEYVSHGAGSGGQKGVPTVFSDTKDSHSSVRGVMVTTFKFNGKHGESLRLQGLEKFNKKANARDIEVHPAGYATTEYVKEHGFTGRSWGCFAVSPEVSHQIIQLIKNGSVLFAYAPQAGDSPNYDES